MGAGDEQLVLAGGTLYADGTALGTVHAVALEYVGALDDITAEEFGGEVWDQVFLREEVVCTAVLSDWDADALAAYFPNFSGNLMTVPGAHVYGTLQSTKAVELSYTPHATHGGFVLVNALPQLARATLRFSGQDPLLVEATWLGVRDSTGSTMTITSATPTSIFGNGLAAWWDASDSDTITSDVNGVSQWSDKSGNGHDLVQASNDLKPTVASAAFNGLDALLFDGVDDLLTAATAPVTGPEFWVFLVAAHTGNTGSSPFSLYNSANSAQNYYFQRVNVVKNWLWVVNSGAYAQTSTSDTNGQAALVVAHESSSTSRTIELGGAGTGTDATSATPSGINAVDVGRLRSNLPLTGHVMEIAVVSGSITAAQLTAMESYISTKWGVTIS